MTPSPSALAAAREIEAGEPHHKNSEQRIVEKAALIDRHIKALVAQVATLQNIQKTSCEDWAEDHTHLQALCIKAGYTEEAVNGDSYGVPDIIELADMLAAKLPVAPNGKNVTDEVRDITDPVRDERNSEEPE